MPLIQFPNIVIVLLDRTITGEKTSLGNIHKRFFHPTFRILIILDHLILGRNIGFQIQQSHEPIFMIQILIQPLQTCRML